MERENTELYHAEELEKQIYHLICKNDGITARKIASELKADKTEVNRLLYNAPLMHELCYQDSEYNWHGLIRQATPHEGLYDFSGFYGTVGEFLALSEEEWLERLEEGCARIGRNLNDTRGLIHSFLDCRETMVRLFDDLKEMTGKVPTDWETVFELRIKRARHIRIYADVLLISKTKVFSFEFKMKDKIDPEEVRQAAKYVPYLSILFGPGYEIIPALVLTKAADLYEYEKVNSYGISFGAGQKQTAAGKLSNDAALAVCSGDMLFNVLNDVFRFLK